MTPARFPTFGQELYLRETVMAAKLLAELGLGRGASEAVAERLSHPSPKTRERIAAKLVQRLISGASRADAAPHFVRLVAGLQDATARRELIYYATTRADPLVGAIARDILHTVLLDRATPAGARREELEPHRTGLLLTVEPVVSMRFVLDYAARVWGFTSRRSVLLALRILRQAGITRTQRLRGAAGLVTAVALAPHGISLPTFVWCFMDEFGSAVPAPTVDRIERSSFARTLVVSTAAVDARLDEAEQEGFVHTRLISGAHRVVPAMGAAETVDRILGG